MTTILWPTDVISNGGSLRHDKGVLIDGNDRNTF